MDTFTFLSGQNVFLLILFYGLPGFTCKDVSEIYIHLLAISFYYTLARIDSCYPITEGLCLSFIHFIKALYQGITSKQDIQARDFIEIT